jgi:hypothetical protein
MECRRASARDLRPANKGIPMSDRKDRLVQQLKNLFGELTGEDLGGTDQRASFLDLGLDSLLLTQVSQSKRFFNC